MAALFFAFVQFVKLAHGRADYPVAVVLGRLRERSPLLLLPALLWPSLLAGYTTAKVAIPFIVGYGWDGFWADADRAIFGRDAWAISVPLVEWAPVRLWEWVYSAGWGFVLFAWLAALPFFLPRRRLAIAYTATFACWLVGGCIFAFATSAAGPAFAHIVDPALADRFLPMRQHLALALSPEGPIRRSQEVLAIALQKRVAIPGSGISAMPSMHLAMTTIYILTARRSWWLVPSCLFWLIIFIGSAYFGYHYWLDGIFAALVAIVCWKGAELLLDPAETGAGRAAQASAVS